MFKSGGTSTNEDAKGRHCETCSKVLSVLITASLICLYTAKFIDSSCYALVIICLSSLKRGKLLGQAILAYPSFSGFNDDKHVL